MNEHSAPVHAEVHAAAPSAAIENTLRALRARKRLLNGVAWSIRAAFAGAVLAIGLGIVLVAVYPEDTQVARWLVLLCVPLGALLGGLGGWLQPVEDLQVARALDRAAGSADRFASAIQLTHHRRPARAQLVLEDALSRVQGVEAASALPMRAPAMLKWLPAPVVAVTLILWLAPAGQSVAESPAPPEISAEEWAEVNHEFQDELATLPDPVTEEEKQLLDELRELGHQFEKQPSKKDALLRIAALRAQLENRQQGQQSSDVSMQQAARAMQPAEALRQLAALLQKGDYAKAAEELNALAQRLQQDQQKLTAADFEAVSADFDALAAELSRHAEMSQACRQCASAASSMNRQSLAESLKRLSQSLKKNSNQMRTCDSRCRSKSLLNRLAERLNKCRGGKCGSCSRCGNGKCSGNCSSFARQSNKRGGLRAGWGTADNWQGGAMPAVEEQRNPDVIEAQEREGDNTVLSTISPEERATSAQDDRDRFADLIRKAESDLDLETVPLAYREYLRRYFVSIRPSDVGEPAAP